jgi:hypothetical protein
MKRQPDGVVNAYILNFMVHADTLLLDEQEIRDKVQSRFKKTSKRKIRPQNIRKFHIEPMIKRHWLREADGKYERIGELKHISPRQTLRDQFEGLPEEYIEGIVYNAEYNRRLFGHGSYEESLSEEEFKEYIESMYNQKN